MTSGGTGGWMGRVCGRRPSRFVCGWGLASIGVLVGVAAPGVRAQGGGPSRPSVQAGETPEERAERLRELREQRRQEALERRRQLAEQRERAQGGGAAEVVEPLELVPEELVGVGELAGSEGSLSFNFGEAVELSALVDYVSRSLGIVIIEDPGLAGQRVVFRAPLEVAVPDVLPLLQGLLNDKGFVLVKDQLGFYRVRQAAAVPPVVGATTRIIATPTLSPTGIRTTVTEQLGQAPPNRMTALDDLGVLMVTAPPEQLEIIEMLVQELVAEALDQRLFPFALSEVSADYARTRIVALNGSAASGVARGARPAGAAAAAAAAAGGGGGGSLSNLASRLYLDQGNVLLFRGSEEEASIVQNFVEVVDRVTPLVVRRYVAGSVALDAAQAGERLGLGPVTIAEGGGGGGGFGGANNRGGGRGLTAGVGGADAAEPAVSGFTVSQETGTVLYYGTPQQHARVDDLIETFKQTIVGESVEIRTYKLLYAKAEGGEDEEGQGVAGILRELIEDPQQQFNESPFLPRSRGGVGANLPADLNAAALADGAVPPELAAELGLGDGTGTRLIATTENTIIVSDQARNQIIIKAPARAQDQFAEIIRTLDQRQPQVQIEAQIISVTTTDTFNFSSDVQLNIGEFSWFSAFGATSPGDSVLDVPGVAPSSGLTTGIIQTDFVPIAIQALTTVGETKVESVPQVLVNDNQTANLDSQREVPFATTSQTANSTVTGQGGTAEAGTSLEVTPRISEGDDITLEISVELSDFTGDATGGLQPPVQRDSFESVVTLPTDSTIVVGGFRLNRTSETERKVPLLGDIPLLGNLFKSYATDTTQATIFIFITPRVLRDPSGADLVLLSEGPLAEVGAESNVPRLEPALIPISGSVLGSGRIVPVNEAARSSGGVSD